MVNGQLSQSVTHPIYLLPVHTPVAHVWGGSHDVIMLNAQIRDTFKVHFIKVNV